MSDVPTEDTEVEDDGDDSTPGVPDAQQRDMPPTDQPPTDQPPTDNPDDKK